MSCHSKLVHGVHREVRRIAQHRVECERKAFNVVVKLVECTSAEEGELEEVVCMWWTHTSCTYVVGTHKLYICCWHTQVVQWNLSKLVTVYGSHLSKTASPPGPR